MGGGALTSPPYSYCGITTIRRYAFAPEERGTVAVVFPDDVASVIPLVLQLLRFVLFSTV